MDILLHICCGPCLIYPLGRLKEQGFKISGFYYNPNIHPVSEYYQRLEGVKLVSQEFSLSVEYSEYNDFEYLQAISTPELLIKRCVNCWSLRLQETARRAKEKNFKAFSTTLLVSPYQNHESLKQLGEQIGRAECIDFYYEDFRVGFKQAQLEAKNKGIYRQKYCGCKYSLQRV